jgi:ATPase family associated with various cellular activities (AAA)
MRPEKLAATIESVLRINRMAVFVESPPGTGKTSIIKQVAERMGLPLIYLHAPTKLPEDFGLPWPDPNSDSFSFRMLDVLPLESSKHPEEGIVLFDELPQAGPDIQKILANMLWEREVHGHKIKSGWRFVCTGNRVADRAGANRLLSHLRNRLITLSLDVDAEEWCWWAQNNGVDERVIAFMRFSPQSLNNFRPDQEINATPRSWAEGVSPLLNVLPPDAMLEVAKGCIGNVAAEFVGFLRHYGSLPSRAVFLERPAEAFASIPRNERGQIEPSLMYALANMLLVDISPEAYAPAMAAAEVLPLEYGSMVFQTFLKRCHQGIARQEALTTACYQRYKGIVIGEYSMDADEPKSA